MCTHIKVGARIKMRREELNYTQSDIASKLGVNKSTIQRYETGEIKIIKIPMLEAIARILDVDPKWLSLKTDIQSSYYNSEEAHLNYKSVAMDGTPGTDTTKLNIDDSKRIKIAELLKNASNLTPEQIEKLIKMSEII